MEKYKFSIVVPIYNLEKYLEESIESLINQTIGFEENIQLILVNDGSQDDSEKICLKYKNRYPQNVIYIKQENKGVSAARNLGKEYIEGKYVNFLDGDDKWSLDALEIIYNFIEKNYNEIDFVAARKKLFDAKQGFHALDYKFEETKIVDIFEDYTLAQMDVTSVVLKADVAKQFKFNECLKYAEDADYINKILLKKQKYGVVREAVHLYRKRRDDISAMQNKRKAKSWYIDTIEFFHKKIIENSFEIYGKIIPYVQYVIMYDLQWRIKNKNYDALDENEKNDYINNILELLKKIDDYIIVQQKRLKAKLKIYVLSLKYEKDIIKELEFKNGIFYFNNLEIYNIQNKKESFFIENVEIKENVLEIQGKTLFAIPINTYELFYNTNLSDKTKIELQEDKDNEIITFKEETLRDYAFNVRIQLKKKNKISFWFEYKTTEYNIMPVIDKKLTTKNQKKLKTKDKNYIITYDEKSFIIKKINFMNKIKRKLKKALTEYIKN